MTDVLRAIVVAPDAESAGLVRRLLTAHPLVAVVGEFTQPAEAAVGASARRPDLVVVDVGPDGEAGRPAPAVRLVESLAQTVPGAAIVVTGPSLSADFVIQVMRAGALEFVRRPVQRDDLFAALDKVLRLRRSAPPARDPGHVIAVFSAKGGTGATTLAVNLAVGLAERAPGQTILVELDTRHSDTATWLNLQPSYSVLDALENLDRLDESFLRGLLSKHRSGLAVLPGPTRIERTSITGEQVEAGLAIIRSHFDRVVLDLRHDFDPGTIAALEAADTVLFLTGLAVSALRSSAAALAAFRHLGLGLDKVRVVVMREDTGGDVTLKHAREALGLPIFWRTPSDYRAVTASINRGEPIVTAFPRSKVARNLRELAVHFFHHGLAPARAGAPQRAGALGRLIWSTRPLSGDG
jgi:pilus assembly protein CpaE